MSQRLEEHLRNLWAKVLDRDPSKVQDDGDFFEAGGDSVAVMQLVRQAHDQGIALTAQTVYEHPTLGGLCSELSSDTSARHRGRIGPRESSHDNLAADLLRMYDLVTLCLAQASVERGHVLDIVPCTPFQAEIMTSCHNDGAWVFQTVWELEAGNEARARNAIDSLYEANDVFRTRIVQLDSGFWQVVCKPCRPEWDEYIGSIHDFKVRDSQRRMTFGQPLCKYAVVRDRLFMADINAAFQEPITFSRQPNRPSFLDYTRYVTDLDQDKALDYWARRLSKVPCHDILFPEKKVSRKESYLTSADHSVRRWMKLRRPLKSRVGLGAISEVAWALCLAARAKTETPFFVAMRGGRHAALLGVESILGSTFSVVPVVASLSGDQTLADLLNDRQEAIYKEIPFENHAINAMNKHFGHKRYLQTVLLPQMPEPDAFHSTMRAFDEETGRETVLRSAQELWTQVRGHFGLYIMLTPKTDERVELWARFDESVVDEKLVHELLEQYEHMLARIVGSFEDWNTMMLSDLCPNIQRKIDISGNDRGITLRHLARDPSSEKPAFIIPAESPVELSYQDLFKHTLSLQEELASLGISKGSAVSISLPNSYEIVTSFLAITWQRAIAAPLNPSYKQDEFEFYIEDLGSSLMITEKGAYEENTAAVRAAKKFGAAVIEVTFDGSQLRVDVKDKGKLSKSEKVYTEPEEDDIALVLHTSGTTGRPKAVPLTHKNLITNIDNTVDTYKLTNRDRTMLIMPLFHVHGLLASFLSPLRSNGSAVVFPRLQPNFWSDFVRLQANWYSATPSMHRLILSFPPPDPLPSIRFIRSCSSQLAPNLYKQLEETYHAPVLESYAMTEASHLMASNPLPPAPRYPGCVGLAQGQVEMRLLDQSGAQVPLGSEGEVCVRGDNVTRGYLNNKDANATSFTADGFFRTGDQGRLDAGTGYLTLTGRLKEMINRGGEKISPVELDDVVGTHEAVAEAVCFGVDDEVYGQAVGAAVRRHEGADLSADALKEWLRERVAPFKVPRDVWFLDEIPKTATGKLQRRLVADKVLEM